MDYYDLPTTKTFLVSQKALIREGDSLLILRSGCSAFHDSWELPGGLLEIDEDFESGLKREIREETGLEIGIGQIITTAEHWERDFTFRDGRTLDVRVITLIYLCEKIGGAVRLSHEHVEFKWATHAELADLRFLHSSEQAVRAYLT